MAKKEWELRDGETLVGEYKAHKGTFLAPLIGLIIGLLITLIAYFFAGASWKWEFCLILTFTAVLWLGISNAILYFSTTLVITDQSVLGAQTIQVYKNFSEDKELDENLEDVERIKISQDFLARKFGYGNIVISTAQQKFRFKNIETPDQIREKILKQQELKRLHSQ